MVTIARLREICRRDPAEARGSEFDACARELLALRELPPDMESAEDLAAFANLSKEGTRRMSVRIEARDAQHNAQHAAQRKALEDDRGYWKKRAEDAEALACELGDAKQHVAEAKVCTEERQALKDRVADAYASRDDYGRALRAAEERVTKLEAALSDIYEQVNDLYPDLPARASLDSWLARASRLVADKPDAPSGAKWRVRLVCCGREDGIEVFDTWEAANAFREDYTTGVGVARSPEHRGHQRSAVMESGGAK